VIFISIFVHETGFLAGLAIGDVLGAPLEGLPPRRKFVTEMEGGGLHRRNAGEYTDDTLQALAVARSLVQCRGYSPDDMMTRLLAAYSERPAFFGPTSSAVFELVLSGVPPEDAAARVHRDRGSRSDGSVMRGPPLAIFYEGEELREVSLACSRLTHRDPVAGECSAFLNQMVAALVRGGSRNEALSRALALCREPETLAAMSGYDLRPPVPGLAARECTHAAVLCFMRARSFEEAVLSAVNLGGDADTVGACTGALAGAYWGLDRIPGRWKQQLEEYPKIVALATDLARAADR